MEGHKTQGMNPFHKIAKQLPAFGEVITEQGETFIHVRIPVSRRLSEGQKTGSDFWKDLEYKKYNW